MDDLEHTSTPQDQPELPDASRDERYRALFEDAAIGIIEIDEGDRIVAANRAFCAMLGYALDELIGRTIHDLSAPEDAERTRDLSAKGHSGELRTFEYEKRYVRRDGSLVWAQVTVSVVRDAGGRFVRAVASITDISRRKQAEQSLRAERDFSDALLDTIGSLVVVLDGEGRIVRFNKACERTTGYTASEVLGRSVFETLIPDADVPGTSATFAKLRMGGFPNSHRNAWKRKDGSSRTIAWSNTAIVDERGAVEFIIATGTDVTEHEQAAEALRASEARFRSVFEQAAIGIARVRFSDARWIDVNDAFCRMLGRSREEMLATAWPEITHPEDVELDLVPFQKMTRGELDSYTVEKRFIHRDGHHVWAKLTLSVVRDASGRPDYEVAIIEDIGDRKRAEDAMRDAARRKDEFLGMLSHELRNPLAPIRSSVYVLRHTDPASLQASRARDVIERQTEHLTRLVDDLLDVTRIGSGKILLHRDRVDLRELVKRTVEDARGVIESRGVKLLANVPETKLWADADATRISQVIGNLLSNARKFTHAGGEIVVSLREVDAMAEISVRDTGAGIDRDLLPNLFEAFVQGQRTLSRSEGGLGLGLALVRGLTELHGGSVRAVSEGRGRGSEFLVLLPLIGPLVDERPVRTAPHPSPNRRRVLVVDDNADAAESLAEVVELFGHDVEIAYDGPTAIEKARQTPPDVVLCDIGLPGMSGYDVARALRSSGRPMQLFAVSGYAQPEDVNRAIEAGFDGHVAKPPELSALERLLA